MSTLKFRMAAKTDVGLVRQNNEDNFQASADLTQVDMRWVNNEICSLGEKGALLVVADGMGGMNAGEVASELAIETVKDFFVPEKLTPEVMNSRYSIEKFMNSVIVAADERIKSEAKSNPEAKGMGTTIVIGWLLDGKLYVSWCGDSRAYVYNPKAGLHQISKDHSYVQQLVDKGAITKEDAFDYPESNIITRCLSDSSQKAKPESLLHPYDVCDNDIIMLCTDGLCGMIHDNEIEAVIRQNEHDMDKCSDDLIQAACDAEGSDNITICLCQILHGAGTCLPEKFDEYDARLAGPGEKRIPKVFNTVKSKGSSRGKMLLIIGVPLICILAAGIGTYLYMKGCHGETNKNDSLVVKADTLTRDALGQDTISENEEPSDDQDVISVPVHESNEKDLDKKQPIKPVDATAKPVKTGDDVSGGGKTGDSGEEPDVNDNKDKDPSGELTKIEKEEASQVYEVQEGDNASSIASRFGMKLYKLIALNPSVDMTKLQIGQKIKVINKKK